MRRSDEAGLTCFLIRYGRYPLHKDKLDGGHLLNPMLDGGLSRFAFCRTIQHCVLGCKQASIHHSTVSATDVSFSYQSSFQTSIRMQACCIVLLKLTAQDLGDHPAIWWIPTLRAIDTPILGSKPVSSDVQSDALGRFK